MARCTRPDIAFAVHKSARQTHQPRVYDFKLAKRIARYLKGTREFKLRMAPTKDCNGDLRLEAYSGNDFVADKIDRKSLTGGVVRLNGMTIRWSAKKQGGVSISTREDKFVAASKQSRELLGIHEMLSEIERPPALPMLLNVNNKEALKQLAGEASSLLAKHIDIRMKFVCDNVCREIVLSQYIRSELQLADLLTKALDAAKLAAL